MSKVPKISFETQGYQFIDVFDPAERIQHLPHDVLNPNKSHQIDFYLLLFIKRGNGVHYVDHQQYEFEENSIIMICKDQVHAFDESLWSCNSVCIVFEDEFLLGSKIFDLSFLYDHHLYNPIIKVPNEEIALFNNTVGSFNEQYQIVNSLLQLEVLKNWLSIILLKSLHFRSSKEQTNTNYVSAGAKLLQLLKEDIFRERRVAYYADRLDMSPKSLNTMCRNVFRMNGKEFISKNLIVAIKRMLLGTEESVTDICYESGFNDPANFVKFFKQRTGFTPSEFRQKGKIVAF